MIKPATEKGNSFCTDFLNCMKIWTSEPLIQAYFPRMNIIEMTQQNKEIEERRRKTSTNANKIFGIEEEKSEEDDE